MRRAKCKSNVTNTKLQELINIVLSEFRLSEGYDFNDSSCMMMLPCGVTVLPIQLIGALAYEILKTDQITLEKQLGRGHPFINYSTRKIKHLRETDSSFDRYYYKLVKKLKGLELDFTLPKKDDFREYRVKAGLTKICVAKELGINVRTLDSLEANIENCMYKNVIKLYEFYRERL